MKTMNEDQIRQTVRDRYEEIAQANVDGCGCGCGSGNNPTADEISLGLGYSEEEVSNVPEGANMGLGCGNPQAIASLKPGETVLDLGSGGGFDCFLSARAVGHTGFVIGVDMTPEMISKARANAEKAGFNNVEFRLGEIESLPVVDNSVDVIISNCVINLSPVKQKVYNEAFRVLKPGGRLAVSDVVATQEIPDSLQKNISLYIGCISGASLIEDIESMLKKAGFTNIRITTKAESKEIINEWPNDSVGGINIGDYVISANIEALKPE
jgi:ubiquinone/menaquinone biosynthesis C-methylase UbiE